MGDIGRMKVFDRSDDLSKVAQRAIGTQFSTGVEEGEEGLGAERFGEDDESRALG